jgi:hypothetical protein
MWRCNVNISQLESNLKVIERSITYSQDITNYRNAMVQNISLNNSLAISGMSATSEVNPDIEKTIKTIDDNLVQVMRPVQSSSGLTSEEAKRLILQAIAAAREAAKSRDPDVKAVFEGIETYLCRAQSNAYPNDPPQISTTDARMNKLHQTVSSVQTTLEERTDMKAERKTKLTSEVESLAINIQATQNSQPFANGSTFDDAKKSTLSQLSKLEKSTSFKQFITEVKNKISKIGKVVLPKMAQHLIKEHDKKIDELKQTTKDIKGAKESVQSLSDEPRSPGKR